MTPVPASPVGREVGLPSGRRDLVLTVASAVSCAALAWWLRRPAMDWAFTGDEVANFIQGGFLTQLQEPESGVNPPLWRWLMNLRAQGPGMLAAARAMSMEASLLGVAVGALAARAVGGRWWCALLGGLLLACHPWSITGTTVARAYGLLTLLLSLHLLMLIRWAEAPDRRRSVGVALTAILLPWTHYSTVPWLLLVGVGTALTTPRLRRLPLLYAPAALAFLPLAWRILAVPDRREPPTRTVVETVDLVLGLGLHTRRLPDLGPFSWTTWVVLGALVAVALAWWRAPDRLRVAWWSALAVPAGAAALNAVQLVRPVTSVVMVVAAAPLLAGAAGVLPRPWQRALAAIGGGLALAWPMQVVSEVAGPSVHREAVREVARLIDAGSFPGEGPVAVHPQGEGPVLFFYLAGRHASKAPSGGPCEGIRGCMVLRERAWVPRDVVDPREVAWVVSFARTPLDPAGCSPVDAPPGARIWRCDAGSAGASSP